MFVHETGVLPDVYNNADVLSVNNRTTEIPVHEVRKIPTMVKTNRVPQQQGLLEKQAVASLEAALGAIRRLTDVRLKSKLSVSRITGVARELRGLIDVLSNYGC